MADKLTMEPIKNWLKSIWKKVGKYKYAVLILLLGMGLILIPERSREEPAPQISVMQEEDLESKMEKLLEQIHGAGKVEVLLTLEEGESKEYQTNLHQTVGENQNQLQRETVLISQGSGQEQPVVVTSQYPVYRGAVVVCQGADRASVRLDILNAVSSLTGLGSNKIQIIKMQTQ